MTGSAKSGAIPYSPALRFASCGLQGRNGHTRAGTPRLPALPQARGAMRLRSGHAVRQSRRTADPAAPAGAGPPARLRAARRAAFHKCAGLNGVVVAVALEGSRPRGRAEVLGDPLSRLAQGRGA